MFNSGTRSDVITEEKPQTATASPEELRDPNANRKLQFEGEESAREFGRRAVRDTRGCSLRGMSVRPSLSADHLQRTTSNPSRRGLRLPLDLSPM